VSELAVLVLNWNGRRWLDGCLGSVLDQVGRRDEVWLIDNGSCDGSAEHVAGRFPGVRVSAFGRNLGFAEAYNRAVAGVDAGLVLLLNNDVVLEPGCLAALRAAMEADPDAAAVGAKLLFMERPGTVNHAGGRLTLLGSAYDLDLGAPDGPGVGTSGACGCATGAAMLVRRAAFEAVGGFDGRYFAYFEDADLCWRFWLRGYTVRHEPAARVLHAYGGSTGRQRASLPRIELCQANRLRNMAKNLAAPTLLRALPASLAFDAYRMAEFARAANGEGVAALASGTGRFLRHLPETLARRRAVQPGRVRSDDELLRSGVVADLWTAAREWRRLAAVAPTS
jgi:GT2 family glycosyltransferase